MTFNPKSFRGIASVKADASNPNAILAQLTKAFEDFKAENDARLKGKADVLTDEKVDRINASVGDLQAALDEQAKKLAAFELNGVGSGKGRVVDAEYTSDFKKFMKTGDVSAALTKTTPADGGFTAPTEWDRTITDKLVIISPMRQMCSVQSISVNAFSKLFNNKGTVSGWVGETAARPETATPTFGSVTYTTGELYANPSATQQMLDDGQVDLEQWLATEVEQEFSLQENIAFVSGTGANGRPNGILTYVTGAANAAAHPYGAITLTNSGAAATVTADGIINLVHALPSAFLQNAMFAMNRDTMRTVRLLKDTTNQYLWQPSYQADTPSTLAGYAVSEVAAMPNLAAASKSILFGDFKRSYLIVDRVGVRLLRDPFTNKPYVMFYTTKRVGGGLLSPESMKCLNTSV